MNLNPKVRKYLFSELNDPLKASYNASGGFSGLAKCPKNINKESHVSSLVKLKVEDGLVTMARVFSVGPPLITAASNLAAESFRGCQVDEIRSGWTKEYVCDMLLISDEEYDSTGLWSIEKALDAALSDYKDKGKI